MGQRQLLPAAGSAAVEAESEAAERSGDHVLAEPVRVPWMHHHALVHEANEHLLALARDDRGGRREALAVDRKAA